MKKEELIWTGVLILAMSLFSGTFDNGRIITTAMDSAGIDGALHVVARILGDNEAAESRPICGVRHVEARQWQGDDSPMRFAPQDATMGESPSGAAAADPDSHERRFTPELQESFVST